LTTFFLLIKIEQTFHCYHFYNAQHGFKHYKSILKPLLKIVLIFFFTHFIILRVNCTSLLMGDNLQMHEEMDNDSVFFDFSNFTTEEFLESSSDEEFPQMHLTQLSDEEHESIDEYDYEYGCNSINYSKECDKLFLPSGNLDFGKDITLPFMMLPLSLQNCVSKNSTKAIKNLHPYTLQVIIFKNLIIIADLFLLKIFTKTVCFFYSLKIC